MCPEEEVRGLAIITGITFVLIALIFVVSVRNGGIAREPQQPHNCMEEYHAGTHLPS